MHGPARPVTGHGAHDSGHCYLNGDVLEAYASHYAEPAQRDSPLVSPLWGEFEGYPPLCILTGEVEALYPQNLALARRAQEAGVEVSLHVGAAMVHVWPALTTFLPEGDEAFGFIARFIASRPGVVPESQGSPGAAIQSSA